MNAAKRIGIAGGVTALVGLVGRFGAELYFREHPVERTLGNLVSKIGGDFSLQTRVALFFADFGIFIALIGGVLMALAFLLRR
ncbi:MAG: hypothetical protein ACOC0K_02060 [bacterium]